MSMGTDELTSDEVAERAGTTPARIHELVDLGILEPSEVGSFRRLDVLRTRVVADLEAIGIEPRGIATALQSGHLSLGYLESAGRRHPRSERTFAQVAEDLNIPFATLERIYVAFGLASPAGDEYIREEDLQVIRTMPALFSAGIEEGDVLRAARVWGEGARRVAQYLTHYFHMVVEEPFRRRGLGDNQAFEAAIREVGLRIGRSGEEMLAWLYRRHSETYLTQHQFAHAETALEEAGVHERSAPHPGAAAFADLSGYTRLTEEAGDEVAADVSLRLGVVVSEVAVRHRGTVVKMLGDGVHFHFGEPRDAVLASLDIVESVSTQGLPPAHVGIEAGPMVYDEGDYFGRTVNLAARIASQAGPDQVFVGEGFASLVRPSGFRLVEVGAFVLKGISEPVTLHEAIRDGDG
jgi:adenylate cyclase